VKFREILRESRRTASSAPLFVRPFLWLAALCVAFFAWLILPVVAFCRSMRPLYQRRRK
jgi:hypothetical protein